MKGSSLRFRHPLLQLRPIPDRGAGYVATGLVKRGELLLEEGLRDLRCWELRPLKPSRNDSRSCAMYIGYGGTHGQHGPEKPFVWDSGKSEDPDLQEGAAWLMASGLAHEIQCDESDLDDVELAKRYAFRTHRPCGDGSYPAMLFRSCCRFNHSCFPNAGGHLPGGEDSPSVSQYNAPSLRIYALEEIREGEEVCISYLSETDQLSPLPHRRALLQNTWAFICRCDRCLGGRPLDRRLETMDVEGDRKTALAAVNHEFCSLFDSTFEDYNPPKDFETTLERLNNFRKKFEFLDKAHVFSQRIRRELIAAFLLAGFDSQMARQCAGPALSLLVEEMHVQHALLPGLSPCKVTPYLQFLQLLRHVSEQEARWHVSDLKVDGCELQHQQSLWLHDQASAARLGLAAPRNLPPAPVLGAPLRTGPAVRPGAASAVTSRSRAKQGYVFRCRSAWPQRCHRSEGDEMPPLVQLLQSTGCKESKGPVQRESSSLWDAYADFGRPSKDAHSLRGAGKLREPRGKDSWFKFRAEQTTIAHALLQPTAVLVGDTDYAPDAFAARCLLSEGVAFLSRAASLKPEKVSSLKRRRFRKVFAKHKEQIRQAAISAEPEIFQRLGRWLGVMDAWYEQIPVLMDLCMLKDALAQHLLPLATWGLRPHLRPLLGRVMPPPDPPDAVLKDLEVQSQLRRYIQASTVKPELVAGGYPDERTERTAKKEVVQVVPAVPILMGRLAEGQNDQSEQKPHVSHVSEDRAVESDSGTLDYSTDEEELDGSTSPPGEIGFHRILAPVLT
eukprot:Skav216785  [mRNA]  locus=scaffold1384:40567:44996:+ [translate_table: standard]